MSAPPKAPRVFLSSTFYDLRFLRELLESFLENYGYQPVLHNRGDVAYGASQSLEKDCLAEVRDCEILVNILGHRGGSDSEDSPGTITEQELMEAIRTGITIYVFVLHSAMSEYRSFKANGCREDFKSETDPKIFRLLGELEKPEYMRFVPITEFSTGMELWTVLRKQLAGNVTHMLRDRNKRRLAEIVKRTDAGADDAGHRHNAPEEALVERGGVNDDSSGSKITSDDGGDDSVPQADFSMTSFFGNAKQPKELWKGKTEGFGGIWRAEFRQERPPEAGFQCGLEIRFTKPKRLKEFSILATKFESHGWAGVEFHFAGTEQTRTITLFDGARTTDSRIKATHRLGFGNKVSHVRITFTGRTSQLAWYEVEELKIE